MNHHKDLILKHFSYDKIPVKAANSIKYTLLTHMTSHMVSAGECAKFHNRSGEVALVKQWHITNMKHSNNDNVQQYNARPKLSANYS